MPMRLIISFNVLVGSLALVVALALPLVMNLLSIGPTEAMVEQNASMIIERELAHRDTRRSFVFFRSGDASLRAAMTTFAIDLDTPGVHWHAFSDEGSPLVLRAVADPNAVSDGSIPPFLYEHRVGGSSNDQGKGDWLVPPQRRQGVLRLFGGA